MADTATEKNSTLKEIKKPVGVRFRPCGRVYTFDAGELEVSPGQAVVVESMFGLTIGRVVKHLSEEELSSDIKEVKSIIRIATEDDFKKAEDNRSLQEEAFQFCLERIEARGLPMKLVSTEVTLDRRRIIFYFTADGRIDFRELVKDLAARFRTRIEMRQIGVRDEAKLLGGLGICGRVLCCNSFLSEFAPISIKMAKEQELVLNTSKLTGLCGRLMCCLSYEYEGSFEGEDEMIVEDMEGCLCQECVGPNGEGAMVKEIEETERIEEAQQEKETPEGPETSLKEREEVKLEQSSELEVREEKAQAETTQERQDKGKQPLRHRARSRDEHKRKHKKKRRHGRNKKKKRGKR